MAGYSPAGAGAIPYVDSKLKQKKVMLFTKKQCSESNQVKKILNKYGLSDDVYEFVEIESRQDCTQIENYFFQLCLTNNRAVSIQCAMSGKLENKPG